MVSYAVAMEHTINKTLIIRLSSIGDVILATPLARILREKLPSAQVDFLVKREYAPLVRHNPHLSSVIELDTQSGFEHLRGLRKRIRQEHYDLIIDVQGNLRSVFLRTGSSENLVSVNKRKLARFLLINFKWNVYRSAPAVCVRYLETLRRFPLFDDGKGLEVFIPKEISDHVRQHLESTGLGNCENVVGLCPGSRHATKRWLQERFAQLAITLIKEERMGVFLFGGLGDRELCASIERQIMESTGNQESIANFAGVFSLLETAVAMDACDVVVTNDTGLLHLAAARKRKVVAIFGPTVKEFGFFPYGTESKVFEHAGLYCRPCTHVGGKVCPEGHFRCMKDTSVDDVLSGVRSFLPVTA